MLLTVCSLFLACSTDDLRPRIEKHVTGRQFAILGDLERLMEIPNVASDRENIRRNADLLQEMLEQPGIASQLLVPEGSNPVVYGALEVDPARPTVIFYAHYDGQPVVESRWATDPWQPALRKGTLESGAPLVSPQERRSVQESSGTLPGEWRLYGRASSDDKAPIVALLAALDALQALGRAPSINLKFVLEGEEEAGSTNLRQILLDHQALLEGDVWLLCDGPVHQTRRPQLCFGARGVVGLEMTVYGPVQELHSGHYGNWAPNPAMLLTHLLASMRSRDGEILVPGVAESVRPLTEAERQALSKIPSIEDQLRQEMQIAWNEGAGSSLGECIHRPALNVRGVDSGNVGDRARNAIPHQARASLDFRLVPDLTPELVKMLVEEHLRKQGFHVVDQEPGAEVRRKFPRVVKLSWGRGYPAYRASLDLPVSRALREAMKEFHDAEVVTVPSLGGSVPMGIFHEIFGTPAVVVPMVNHDNHQHAPDENLRLQNLWEGVAMYAVLMATLGDHWN